MIDFKLDGHPVLQQILWATDLHLDAADQHQHAHFIKTLKDMRADSILIGGDICNGANALLHLKHLASYLKKPIYFVLGNHDYYYGSIEEVRRKTVELCAGTPNLHYLTEEGSVHLSVDTALIGDDGWADARAGDFQSSSIELNDYYFILELKDLSPSERELRLQQFGARSAEAVEKKLLQALASYQQILLLIHTPPFIEACLYEGAEADENWAPHFVCKAVGDVLVRTMKENPDKRLLVLCGHSHNGADVQVLPNIRVVTGHSIVGAPAVQGIVEIS